MLKGTFVDLCNEMEAIKHAIAKTLQKSNSAVNGKCGATKNCIIDLPLSRQNFLLHFVRKVTDLKLTMNCCRRKITVENFEQIFGHESHIFKQRNSTTQQRIIGIVNLHFRPKMVDIYKNDNCLRYLFHVNINCIH